MAKIKYKTNSNGLLKTFWNKLRFVHEFEYETLLTHDEVVDTLRQLEDHYPYELWYLTIPVVYKITNERNGDKNSNFIIKLVRKSSKNSPSILRSQGSINTDPETGLIIIKGQTDVGVQLYLVPLVLLFFLGSGDVFLLLFSLMLLIGLWYVTYRQREKMLDDIDVVIMNAKSEQNSY